MDQDDRREAGTLWRGTTAVGVALVIAALCLAIATLWEARHLDSTIGEVLGAREVDAATGTRPELLVGYRTAGGDTMMFAEAIGALAPEIGDTVTVWYSDGNPPKAMIARQRFVWPALLLPVGLVVSGFGLWLMRRLRRSAATDWESELEDI